MTTGMMYLHAHQSKDPPSHLPTYLPAHSLSYLPTYLPVTVDVSDGHGVCVVRVVFREPTVFHDDRRSDGPVYGLIPRRGVVDRGVGTPDGTGKDVWCLDLRG